MSTNKILPSRNNQNMKFQLERILLFSDAVFAIAITLMIIEIKPPHLEAGISTSEAIHELLKEIPIFVGTILSFFLIGLFWYRHHDLMKYVVAYDNKFIRMNFCLLLSIAFLPFSTAFVFENNGITPIPIIFYNLNYIIASIINYRIYQYALNPIHKLCIEDTTQELIDLKKHTYFSISIFVLVIILAIINEQIAPMGYAGFAFTSIVMRKGKA